MSWKHVGTSGFGRLSPTTSTPPSSSPGAAPRATTSRRCRRAGAVGRLLPAPARRGAETARGSTTTRTRSRRRSRPTATAGSRRPGCAARPGSGPGSSTRTRPGRHRPVCSRRSGAWRPTWVSGARAARPRRPSSSTGCGNFFPNPRERRAALAARTYDLVCGTVPRGECEARPRSSSREATSAAGQPHRDGPDRRPRQLHDHVYADGSGESMIVD
jgi:hypothetical protein